MASPDPLARTGRDGCQCPAWVLRCAHWDGRVLILTGPFHGTYGVHGPAPGRPGEKCTGCYAPGSDLPAAKAEFERREALLLEPANA